MIGAVRTRAYGEKDQIANDGIYFVFVIDKWSGEIPGKNTEGEFYWHDIDKILELDKIFREGFETGLPYLKRYLDMKDKKDFQYVLDIETKSVKF